MMAGDHHHSPTTTRCGLINPDVKVSPGEGVRGAPQSSRPLSDAELRAPVPLHRAHLRISRRVWRMVVLATQTPLTRVLKGPHQKATCVVMPSG